MHPEASDPPASPAYGTAWSIVLVWIALGLAGWVLFAAIAWLVYMAVTSLS